MSAPVTRRYGLSRARSVPVVLPGASYNVPLGALDDYARVAAYQPDQPDSRCPVLLDHAQYFRFVSEIVELVWERLGAAARVFVQLRMPHCEPMPSKLLDARVLLGTGLAAQLAFWQCAQVPCIAIADRIRRDLDFPGDNTFVCTSPSDAWLDAVETALVRPWPQHAVRVDRIAPVAPEGGEARVDAPSHFSDRAGR
jgi:hypothetical protein